MCDTETIHEKSLRLVTELFESMSDEEFLVLYDECEKHIGPTIDDFIMPLLPKEIQ